ncbi:hypothetical protein BD626DRAFT_509577 [Schizophyllum amplum]|uniref:Endopeptidase S2P n=1 Tax=Schizophyllum amplum TaxID=97359 RepID=A0A550C2L6_9AGAR|nr:hypothetical protein BD626DRAFT_509577 [Auriculariopsis ampla]
MNGVHDALVRWALQNSRLRGLLCAFYDLGTITCGIGALVALSILAWTTARLLLDTVSAPEHATPPLSMHNLAKRGMATNDRTTDASSGFDVRPIIPGVTVPISHLPLMLMAVLIGQIVHELGHAAASALEQVHMTAAGLSIMVIFPSAFVTLPSAAIDALSPRGRLRIISGGPFHNLCYYVALVTVRWCGVLTALAPIVAALLGYENISVRGEVVVDVDPNSHLHAYIPRGALITRFDDFTLNYTGAWSDFFEGTYARPEALGWCVSQAVISAAPDTCCEATLAGFPSPLACFVEGLSGADACLDPVPLLGDPIMPRCGTVALCGDNEVCALPSRVASLVRVWFQLRNEEKEEIVIWNGERDEIREAVQTSIWLPEYWLLPLGLPGAMTALFQYLELATLSLFLFNLLPLPMLDGEQYAHGVLDLVLGQGSPYDEFDVEALESAEAGEAPADGRTWSSERSVKRLKARIQKVTTRVTTSLLVACLVLGTLQGVT